MAGAKFRRGVAPHPNPKSILGHSPREIKEKPMKCPKCGNENAKRFGYYGRRKIQRYRCRQCRATFNVAPPSPLGTHYTSPEVASRIVAMMMEGVSVRAIARL